jgi:coenzyme PQQ synthesis protein D (PqqD)
MDGSTHVVRAAGGDGGVATRRFGAETLLVPVSSGVGDLDSVYTLNEVGTTIWNALAEPMALTDVVATVAREYEVTGDQARHDVEAFLSDLLKLRLVHLADLPQ